MSHAGPRTPFGPLLRRARLAAGLTQEELAARSGLSARGVSDLERGTRRAPRRATLESLLSVLCLTEPERQALEQARLAGAVRQPTTHHARPSGSPPSPAGTPGGTVPFIGRDFAFSIAEPLVSRLRAGTGAVIVVAGEPGIGKTRFVEEVTRTVIDHGARAIWGRCSEIEGAPAYWPWIQLIDSWLHQLDDAQIQQYLGFEAPVIGQIVPAIRQRLPHLPDPPPVSPDRARFRLFDAITSWLKRVTGDQPLVVVIDDLHWADPVSLQVLQTIVPRLHELPLLVIVTYRDTEIHATPALRDVLDALIRHPTHASIRLTPWDTHDVADVIEQFAGAAPPAWLATAIQQRADGNPFFVVELVRLLSAGGPLLAIDAADLQVIPGSVRGAIRRRISVLSRDCRDLLEIAAVIGREFSLPVLAAASGRSLVSIIDILDEAARAHIIQEPSATARVGFVHVLISETLAGDIGTRTRMTHHARIAAAIAAVHADGVAAHLDDIAYHFRMAAPIGFAQQAIDYALAAARRSMSHAAWERAIDHYQHALGMFSMLSSPDPARRCAVLLDLGDAQNVAGGLFGLPAARETFEQAAELAFELGDADSFARAAIGYGGINALSTTGGARQVALLEEALAMLRPGDSATSARVLGRLAATLMDRSLYGRDVPRARALSERALAMARRLDNPITLVYALLMWHIAHAGPDETDERLAAMNEAIGLAEASGQLDLVALAYELRCNDLLELGDVAESRRSVQRLHDLADELQLPLLRWSLLNREAVQSQSAGQFKRVEELVGQLRQERGRVSDRLSFLKLFFLFREQGRLDEIADAVRAWTVSSTPLFERAFSLILDLETGSLDEARMTLEQINPSRYEQLDRDGTWLLVLALHAEAAYVLDDRDRADVLFALLSPYDCRNVGTTGNLFLGSMARFLGLLATTRHEWAVAEQQFRNAITMNTRLAMPVYVAHAQYARADMLTRRGFSADRDTARKLLESVRATTRQLGMRPLHDRARALSNMCFLAQRETGLSSRERDVLSLIAEGRANLEIAAALSISPHTVETHVTNILNKLGLDSRTAAATWAVRQGLV